MVIQFRVDERCGWEEDYLDIPESQEILDDRILVKNTGTFG